jgi:hypothetical protein
VAGRLHLRARHSDVERVNDPPLVYDDGSGGSSVPPPGYPPVAGGPAVAGPTVGRVRRPTHVAASPSGSGGLAAGLAVLGLLTIAIGAWGGIVAYLGPSFGYDASSSGSWYWDWQHSLLYLIPGAVAVVTGLWMWALAARTHAGSGRFGAGLAGLLLLAAGAWFVLGPVVWTLFYSTPVFGPASPMNNFLHQLGYNLGPGLILVALGGMTLSHAAIRRRRWV